MANMSDPLTNSVRNNVRQTVEKYGGDPDSICESILIRDGFFCGRRFHADTLQVVWFVEEDELKIYDLDGSLQEVRSASIIDDAQQWRPAA